MARPREPQDWGRDRSTARLLEFDVLRALKAHPLISLLSDFTEEMDAADFCFRFEGEDVRLELKEKRSALSGEIAAQWPEVPPRHLMVVDETSFRQLVWAEGLGYLVVRDGPESRWCMFGPWELCLGPRRRFLRRGDRGAGEFLKGKVLLDLRTAAATTVNLDLDTLFEVVRSSRTALRQVSAVRLRMDGDLAVIPKRHSRPAGHPVPDAPGVAEVSLGARPDEVVADEAWAGLSTTMASKLRAWGWGAPTAVQQRAIPAVLAGRNVLVLGPTAGGKTEAAALPMFDRWRLAPPAARPSILVVSPLRALLQDQAERWQMLGGLVGATAFAWYGDVTQEARRAFKASPTDVLLITPESLEHLLTSVSTDERTLFAGLRSVVVDEVHAFVGTPRGAQLASLLERLDRFVETDLQRVGLSATVGNPQEVLDWVRGGSLREAAVVDAGPPLHGETLSLRSYVGAEAAIELIGSQLAGHRSIVFTRSRRRAEELAGPLGLPTYHSSVAAEHKASALERLRDGEVAAVVATSSLEMGIDLGELDLVVHDGAPNDPASYLQRLGRAGRRTGQRRLVFTTGEVDDLLLILAVVTRARRGDIGRLPLQRGARLVLGQQALAIAFQHLIADRTELRNTLRWSPAFRGLETEIDETIDHLVIGSWLQDTAGGVLVGREGQRRFGARPDRLLATFSSSGGAQMVDGNGRSVGTVDWSQVAEADGSGSARGIALGGRSWSVISVDRAANRVVVEPSLAGKPPSWRGPSLEVERATWEAVREVLTGTEVPLEMDDLAARWLNAARLAWAPRLAVPGRQTPEGVELATFAGVGVHRGVLAMLGFEGKPDGPSLELHATTTEVRVRAQQIMETIDDALDAEASRLAAAASQGLANPELTAPSVLLAESKAFHVDADGLRRVLAMLAGWPS